MGTARRAKMEVVHQKHAGLPLPWANTILPRLSNLCTKLSTIRPARIVLAHGSDTNGPRDCYITWPYLRGLEWRSERAGERLHG